MADLSRIQFEKEKEILIDLIKSFGKKKKREGKEKNKLVIELIQRITISDGGVSLIYPSTARLIESGRPHNTSRKFFGLMKETILAPTSEIQLLTTEELTQALCLDFSFELSRPYFNGVYDVRNFLSFELLKNSPENDKFYCFLDNRKTRKLNYNGNPKASASKGKDVKTNKTLQDWLDAPAAWTLSEIKDARSIATTEEKLSVAEYLKNSNVRDRSTLKADYTGIRLMTDVFDPYELNTISNTIFYNRASTQKDIYANHHYAFMKVGKKVSMHYCDRKMLMKNRGVEERFAPLDPTARRNKNIKNFVIKHFNFLLYAITGKLRSTNLPNSCGFDALRNAHEYNGKVYPEFRILAYLNSLPNLRTKVTYFGMLASTMSGIIDALHFNIDVVDHDIDMILRTDAEKKLPGHIKNINQHYTYTLDDIEAEDYKEAYHHEGKTLSSDRHYGSTMSNAVRAMLQNFIFLCKLKVALLFSVTTTFCAAFLINKVMLAYSFTYMTVGLVVGITAVSIFVPLLLILLGLML